MLMEFLAGVALVIFIACTCYVFYMVAEEQEAEKYGGEDK